MRRVQCKRARRSLCVYARVVRRAEFADGGQRRAGVGRRAHRIETRTAEMASYAYLFKYIIIGDTGMAERRAEERSARRGRGKAEDAKDSLRPCLSRPCNVARL